MEMSRRDPSTAGAAGAGHRMLDVTVVFLTAGFASTAIGPLEVFHSAGVLWNWLHGHPVEPRFRVRTASLDGRPVKSACSFSLTPEFAIGDIDRTDLVVLSASGWDEQQEILDEGTLARWLRAAHDSGAYVAGICSGVAYLAESGLLDGRRATTHWAVAEAMRQRYPKVIWQPEHFVTEDGKVLCSGGVYGAIDLSLYLVEKFCGHEIALQCARSLLVSLPRSCQASYAVVPLSRPHSDERIRQAEDFLQTNFARPVSAEALAGQVGMSPRTLIRRFKAATGRLPGEYLQMLRMHVAREMLERDRAPVQAVSARIGYEDVAFFRSLFKRHTGMTPAEYRSRFARMAVEQGGLQTGAPEFGRAGWIAAEKAPA